MNELFKSKWSTITAKAEKTVDIDIEGIIGFDWWDDEETITNSKEAMKAELKAISSIKATQINVNINSPGGDVNHGFSIHDLLASHPAKVTTKVNGLTASAATVIAQAGDVREMSDNALYLVHNSMGSVFGNKNDLKSMINLLDKVDDRMENLYSKRSGKDPETFKTLMAADGGHGEWITAEEAKEYGLIDNVFQPTAIAANIDFNAKQRGYPDYKYKLTNLKNSKMENENTQVEEKVDSFLDKVLAKISPKKVEKVEPTEEEIQAIADAANAQVEAAKAEKDAELKALQAQMEAKEKELEEMKAKNAKYEAKGTTIEAPTEKIENKKTEEPQGSSMSMWAIKKIKNNL